MNRGIGVARIAYIDPVGGAAGDMLLAALIDAGVPYERLRKRIRGLPVAGIDLELESVQVGAFAAKRVQVVADGHQPQRRLADVLELVAQSGLSERGRQRAAGVFQRLAEAEARVHGVGLEEVHFHEVGAADSIADVVGVVEALELAGIESLYFGELAPGFGQLDGAHGRMPLPAPATLELLNGVPIRLGGEAGEWVTPTAAALMGTLGAPAAECALELAAVGIGAGQRPRQTVPNIVRVLVGTQPRPAAVGFETVAVLEAAIDDATPEQLAHAQAVLMAAGARDVLQQPVTMKKGRLGTVLQVVAAPAAAPQLAARLLAETSSLGVRYRLEQRWVLPRRQLTVQTDYGPVRVKEAERPRVGDRGTHPEARPEADDVTRAAQAAGVAFATVERAAVAAYERLSGAAPSETDAGR